MSSEAERLGAPSRRDFLRIVAMAGGAALIGVGASRSRGVHEATRSGIVMGTYAHLTVFADDPAQAASLADGAFSEMARLERLLTRFPTAAGERNVRYLNERRAIAVPTAELASVMAAALRWASASAGAFDPTVLPALGLAKSADPAADALEQAREAVDYRLVRLSQGITLADPRTKLTLDGIAKGYVVDRTVDFLRTKGMRHVLVEAGGDLATMGTRPGRVHWRVGVRDPRAPRMVATIDLDGRAVATSGDYEHSFSKDFRLHHVIDPATCRPAGRASSATVVAPACMDADALSTATLVLGPRDGIDLLGSLPDVEGLVIDKQGRSFATSRFPTAD